MAASVPTVDAVMLKSFGRPKIVEALQLFGVRAAPMKGAKALKAQLLQLIQDQAPCRMVGDGMVMNGAPAHAPAAAAGTAPGAKPSTASEGYIYIYIYVYKYIAFVARRGQMPQHQHPNALVGKLLMQLLMHIFWLNAATLKADTRNTTGACMGAARPRQRR